MVSETAQEFCSREYDYVVVGGGTAGLVVAARLSEASIAQVGVIEAGQNRLNDPLIDVPGLFIRNLGRPEVDWNFMTVPQVHHGGHVHHISRGKLLGGSSGINFMMYVRGSDADYDDFATLSGDESWSAKNMKHYMRKHQTLEEIDESVTDRSTMAFVPENHGTSGPIHTSFNHEFFPADKDVLTAGDEVAGFDRPVDPLGGNHIGFANCMGTVTRTGPNKGMRSYSARAYYDANKDRPNLHLLCEALASRISISDTKATGVHFLHSGTEYHVRAKREVILACGTIQTPQLLELSGIGNPNILKAAGVECKVDLPAVGENLQDHLMSSLSYEVIPPYISRDIVDHNPGIIAEAQKRYAETKTGPMSGTVNSTGFYPFAKVATEEEIKEAVDSIRNIPDSDQTPFQKKQRDCVIRHLEDPNSANLQFLLFPKTFDPNAIRDQSELFKPTSPGDPMQLGFVAGLQYPVSRGSVHITSSDPSAHPDIDPAFLAHPADVAVLAAGLQFSEKMARSSVFAGKVGKRLFPPEDKLDLSRTEDARQAIREWVMSEYHPVGSCAMGEVVDSRLRVKKLKGLRVVDASVFPNHVSGNIQSSVYAVAEKAADMIKEDAGA